MAISHVQTLLLLASVFFVPAYCGLPFRPCETREGDIASTRLRDSPIDATSGDMIPEIETREGSYAVPATGITVNSVDINVEGEGIVWAITGFKINVTSTQPLGGPVPRFYVYAKIYYGTELIYNHNYYICRVTSCRDTPGVYVIAFNRIIDRPVQYNLNIRVRITDNFNTDKCITFDNYPSPLSVL
ncbi:hypothetical protein AALP_AA8G000800 [Arabis alpina]|uniref:MD-2-related lipid-recognition domain-containing protein n=1 Tax=Arabis alpina TaxID=50452 RepID=A0A087G402_ARAAL|nr:hypothetical protein AALP_AA8G000800 [Arabis alpina]